MKILCTGGAGFIGSEFVRQMTGHEVAIVDKLSYAGDMKRLSEADKGTKFYKIDIASPDVEAVFILFQPDIVVHFASETHVDRSIKNINPFIKTNIIGTKNIAQYCLKWKVKRLIHISTDEVYGESISGEFKETDPIQPNNPYSATKASAEHIIKAFIRTNRLPAIIVRPSNNYGYWQYPEKFMPVIITKALQNKKIPIYGQGLQVREWLHVSDCARGIRTIVENGVLGETYNIGSGFECENIWMVKKVLGLMGKSDKLIKFVPDRKGHDFRYSVDSTKIKDLGWSAKIPILDGIKHTIGWYEKKQNIY